jgi:hypothetical protein
VQCPFIPPNSRGSQSDKQWASRGRETAARKPRYKNSQAHITLMGHAQRTSLTVPARIHRLNFTLHVMDTFQKKKSAALEFDSMSYARNSQDAGALMPDQVCPDLMHGSRDRFEHGSPQLGQIRN